MKPKARKSFLILCCLAAGYAKAEADFNLGWGLHVGAAGSSFASAPHPSQPSSTNLFSLYAGQIPSSQESGWGGGLGVQGNLAWKRVLELRLELGWDQRAAKVVDDLGSGTKRGTEYSRQAAEGALMLGLGWPFSFGRWSLRPFASGGCFGNRTLAAKRAIGIVGEDAKEYAWEGLPNEDWGWVCGGGMELGLKNADGLRRFGDKVSLEGRYSEGQKDLDPKGSNELRARSVELVLSLGY